MAFGWSLLAVQGFSGLVKALESYPNLTTTALTTSTSAWPCGVSTVYRDDDCEPERTKTETCYVTLPERTVWKTETCYVTD